MASLLTPEQTRRRELQTLLESLSPDVHVYFQPPTNVKMAYPCIVYSRDYQSVQHANNLPYFHEKRYSVTVIDRDPESAIPDLVAALPKSAFQRFFVADGLNHDIYNLYF